MGWFPINIREALSLLIPVKDGQLCWAAIAFAASALYEIGTGRSALSPTYVGYVQGGAVLLLSMASIGGFYARRRAIRSMMIRTE